jgi:DDB1- and CUL4-associated factor 7
VRQPGQALLELRGHASSVNSIEWCPSRRGMLASGGDDSLVLIWDLLHASNGASLNGAGTGDGGESAAGIISGTMPGPSTQGHQGNHGQGQQQPIGVKGPAASWRADYEVSNLSWAPASGLTGQGGEWVGVAGGRGVWGVKL